eukprot:PhM_4_TR17639/c0_g1_i1/m.99995
MRSASPASGKATPSKGQHEATPAPSPSPANTMLQSTVPQRQQFDLTLSRERRQRFFREHPKYPTWSLLDKTYDVRRDVTQAHMANVSISRVTGRESVAACPLLRNGVVGPKKEMYDLSYKCVDKAIPGGGSTFPKTSVENNADRTYPFRRGKGKGPRLDLTTMRAPPLPKTHIPGCRFDKQTTRAQDRARSRFRAFDKENCSADINALPIKYVVVDVNTTKSVPFHRLTDRNGFSPEPKGRPASCLGHHHHHHHASASHHNNTSATSGARASSATPYSRFLSPNRSREGEGDDSWLHGDVISAHNRMHRPLARSVSWVRGDPNGPRPATTNSSGGQKKKKKAVIDEEGSSSSRKSATFSASAPFAARKSVIDLMRAIGGGLSDTQRSEASIAVHFAEDDPNDMTMGNALDQTQRPRGDSVNSSSFRSGKRASIVVPSPRPSSNGSIMMDDVLA